MDDTVKNYELLSPKKLLEYWQGNRRLTRKIIEKFPEKELFEFSIGGMRTFSDMLTELIAIAGPSLKAIVDKDENSYDENSFQFKTKEEILKRWDEETNVIDIYYNQIPLDGFNEKFNLYGQYNFPIIENIFYFIDNEIHHRAQGYVYLRSLNIEPPFFWERD